MQAKLAYKSCLKHVIRARLSSIPNAEISWNLV